MARFFLQNESITVSSSQPSTVTGSNGSETVLVGTGNFVFDASFGRGGDTISLAGDAGTWNVTRSGTLVTLTNDAGTTSITLPAGVGGATIAFGDATRTLSISGNQVLLGTQVIGTTAAEIDPGSNGNPSGNPSTYSLSVDAPSVSEGNAGTRTLTFTVSLDRPATASTTINYQTAAGGTASANDDFVPVAGTLVFAAGQQTATVSVLINGDAIFEPTETFNVTFSSTALAGPVTAVGTIVNDDTAPANTVTLTPLNDIVQASVPTTFQAFNNTLGAGDRLTGFGSDKLQLATDGSLGSPNFSGFTTSGISTFEVTSDSAGKPITIDMSGANGVTSLVSTNSSSGVEFRELTSIPQTVTLDNLTNPNASYTVVSMRDVAVAGANDALTVILNETDAGYLQVGSTSNSNGGIETIDLDVVGSAPSYLAFLNSNISTLNIDAAADFLIGASLNSTVATITTAGAGDVSTSASSANQGVSYTRLSGTGSDTFYGSVYSDTITTLDAADYIVGNGGSDVISTAGGNDLVDISGSSSNLDFVNVATGTGNDTISASGGFFDASAGRDQLDAGAGRDVLEVSAGLVDANFQNVKNLEVLEITSSGSTTLQGGSTGFAQAAGIDTVTAVFNGTNVIDASSFTSGLTVNLTYDTDTVTTGSGNDVINFFGDGALGFGDTINAGAGADTVNLYGDLDTGPAVSGVELFKLHSTVEAVTLAETKDPNFAGFNDDSSNRNYYRFQLTNANAPSNGALVIDGSSLLGVEALAQQLGVPTGSVGPNGEFVNVDTTGVTAYSVNATSGGGNDTFIGGVGGNTFTTGAGTDSVTLTGGTNTVSTGDDVDTVVAQAGTNSVNLGAGNDTMTFGTGVDSVQGGAGDDTIFVGVDLSGNDAIDGGVGGDDQVVLLGRDYVDGNFAGVTNVETIRLDSNNALTLGAAASVNTELTTIVDNASGASAFNAANFGKGLTFDLGNDTGHIGANGGGNDSVVGTAFADKVYLGVGDNTLSLGAGADAVYAEGTELTFAENIDGGTGADTIFLDNTLGQVNATVTLRDTVAGTGVAVENFTVLANGDTNPGASDFDNDTLIFTGGNVGSVTQVNVDASALTDGDDTFSLVIDAGQTDADFSFTLTGAQAGVDVILDKQNVGRNNNITFTGGASNDLLIINGNDLGSTVNFNGGSGLDAVVQSGGLITDDGYIGVNDVEVLSVRDTANGINAILGSRAGASGLHTIVAGSGNETVTIDSGFALSASALAQQDHLFIDMVTRTPNAPGGTDTVDAGLTSTKVYFRAFDEDLTAADRLVGGSSNGDRLIVHTAASGVGTADLSGVTGIETIAFTTSGVAASADGTILTIDTRLADLNGTDTLKIVADGSLAGSNALDDNDVLRIDYVAGGVGTDVKLDVTGGAAGDRILTGANIDLVHGGGGADLISGGAGSDVLYGDDGNDSIRGQTGTDTIFGGAGNDGIFGGAGADTLDGGAGADVFYYRSTTDSSTSILISETGRDTINGFVSGEDVINVLGVNATANGQPVAAGQIFFAGNAADFGTAQGAVVDGNGQVEAVYQQDNHVLWFDLDDNGILNGNDLQIVVNISGGNTLQASDVLSGQLMGSAGSVVDFNTQFGDLNYA